jgi:hypothetical protein
MTFIVTVNSTDPIWFYCSLNAHCIAGMVGVVNPPSGQTVSDYVENAAGFRASAPSVLQGGILTSLSPESGSGGVTSMTGSSTSTAGISVETTRPTSTSTGTGTGTGTGSVTTTKGTSTNSGVAATSTPSGGGKSNDASVMLGLGVLGGIFVALMS